MVITFALHAKGPQFETGWKQGYSFYLYKLLLTVLCAKWAAVCGPLCMFNRRERRPLPIRTSTADRRFRSVVVITLVAHVKGPWFDTVWKQQAFTTLDELVCKCSLDCVRTLRSLCFLVKTRVPYGLAVRIPGFHPGGPGSTPGMGMDFGHLDLCPEGYN